MSDFGGHEGGIAQAVRERRAASFSLDINRKIRERDFYYFEKLQALLSKVIVFSADYDPMWNGTTATAYGEMFEPVDEGCKPPRVVIVREQAIVGGDYELAFRAAPTPSLQDAILPYVRGKSLSPSEGEGAIAMIASSIVGRRP